MQSVQGAITSNSKKGRIEGDSEDIDMTSKEGGDSRDPTYFSYYAQFVHQQNMLQDTVRTSVYQNAILSSGPLCFQGKKIMDLGAGSGILSYFAVKAGAQIVYAVEASNMASRIQKLVDASSKTNQWLHGKIQVVNGKVEDVNDLPKVDTLISEPIGVLLVHERMIESYLDARDRFLVPGGTMIPSSGTIFVAPFSDSGLWTQTMAKVRFWEQNDFFGVDFSPLAQDAKDEIFAQPVVGGFDPRILLSPSCAHFVNFETISKEELKDIVIPFTWIAQYTGIIHGIAAWFDINLAGHILSTSPSSEKTHWHQVRLLLKEPIAVNAFETVRGWLRMVANPMRSYDITAEIVLGAQAPLSDPKDPSSLAPSRTGHQVGRRVSSWALHEQTYYFDQVVADFASKPEYIGLYEPDGGLSIPMS